jgi:tRNA(Ile)-lysidine synthase
VPTADKAVTAAEANALFSDIADMPAVVLAVSGGPDSTALLVLAARWAKEHRQRPEMIAVTVDHGLRAEARREALAVGRLARELGIAHRTLRWTGRKPKTGLQEAARKARYRLLAQAARKSGAAAVVTAHTRDDQAETVLIRMSRGSGVTGLGAMARRSTLAGEEGIALIRPLLDISKSRLVATLRTAKIAFAEDSSNRDPRFTRVRLRNVMPALAVEGLDARRLAVLARRLRRADAAIESAVDRAVAELVRQGVPPGAVTMDAAGLAALPAEIALRLIGRTVADAGDEGPVELAKLEALKTGLDAALEAESPRFRRSLAGAIVTLSRGQVTVERAPARRRRALTTGGRSRANPAKTR